MQSDLELPEPSNPPWALYTYTRLCSSLRRFQLHAIMDNKGVGVCDAQRPPALDAAGMVPSICQGLGERTCTYGVKMHVARLLSRLYGWIKPVEACQHMRSCP